MDAIQSKNRKAASVCKGRQHLFLRYLTLVTIVALKIISLLFQIFQTLHKIIKENGQINKRLFNSHILCKIRK